MGIVESLVEIVFVIVIFACYAFCLANLFLGACFKRYGDDERAKSKFLTAGITFAIMIIIAVCLSVFSPQTFPSGLGNWRDQNAVVNSHDKDCQCIDCKPHDVDCQCNDCVEKYCNSFNHGDTCQCEKCLQCK